jgi:carboxylesterase
MDGASSGPGPGGPLPSLDPADQEGTRALGAAAPLIEAHRRRRRRWFALSIGGIVVGLALIAVGILMTRQAGLAALEEELSSQVLDPRTGVRLGAAAFELGPSDARRAALLIHGWCSSPRDFGTIPGALAEQGLFVRALRLPGHGTNPRDFRDARLEDWRAAVRQEYDALAARFEEVAVVGFSMGGALSTELAAERELARLVLIAPYFGLPYPDLLGVGLGDLVRWLEPVLPYVDSGESVRTLACREHADGFMKYRALPLAAAIEVDRLGERVNDPALLETITEPILVVAAPDDPVASSERAFTALQGTSSSVRLEVLALDSLHILGWDCDRDKVRSAVVDFLCEGLTAQAR